VEELLAEGSTLPRRRRSFRKTLPGQRVVLSPLFIMAVRARIEGLGPPALVVVGSPVQDSPEAGRLSRKSVLFGSSARIHLSSLEESFHSEVPSQTGKDSGL